MSTKEALGQAFNLATSATTADTRFDLRDYGSVTIVLVGATSGDATITQATAASAGSTAVVAITSYWTQASGVWTEHTQAAASTITAATGGLCAVTISAKDLTTGYSFISASHASGSFVLIFGDVLVGRDPANLSSIAA